MFIPGRHSGLVLALGMGLAIAHGALVRADPANQPSLADLAQARFDAANKLFDPAWSYCRQKATGTGFVYFASFRLLRAELDLSDKRQSHRRVRASPLPGEETAGAGGEGPGSRASQHPGSH